MQIRTKELLISCRNRLHGKILIKIVLQPNRKPASSYLAELQYKTMSVPEHNWPQKYGPYHDYYAPLKARFEQEDPKEDLDEDDESDDDKLTAAQKREKEAKLSWDLQTKSTKKRVQRLHN